MTEPLSEFPPESGGTSIAEAMMQFNDTMDPVMIQAKRLRERLIADGWGELIAQAIASQVMSFWLSQYMTLMQRSVENVALPTIPPVSP